MAEIPLGTQKQQLYPETPTQFFILDSPTTLVFDQDDSGKTTGIEFITTMFIGAGKSPTETNNASSGENPLRCTTVSLEQMGEMSGCGKRSA